MITLITDFGTSDYFVGVMKGVILTINPTAQIVDITHEIPKFDIEAAAFTLLASYQSFPLKTINVVVVDPEVGSSRRPILVVSDKYFFVGPDNGVFSYVFDREVDCRVYHLTNDEYFRRPVSSTFHGRDIFAPVAGALSNNAEPNLLGGEIHGFTRLRSLNPQISSDGTIEAQVIHIDHFGNCITSITPGFLTDEMIASGARLRVGGSEVKQFRQFFSESNDNPTEAFCVWGSAGFLEIAVLRESAAATLGIKRGDLVVVKPSKAGL